ncbi:hypothetical protein BH11PLA1_BH11PLA1_20060 [soil metagenome]
MSAGRLRSTELQRSLTRRQIKVLWFVPLMFVPAFTMPWLSRYSAALGFNVMWFAIAAPLLTLVALFFVKGSQRRRALRLMAAGHVLCVRCSYDLAQIPPDLGDGKVRCPECGMRMTLEAAREIWALMYGVAAPTMPAASAATLARDERSGAPKNEKSPPG